MAPADAHKNARIIPPTRVQFLIVRYSVVRLWEQRASSRSPYIHAIPELHVHTEFQNGGTDMAPWNFKMTATCGTALTAIGTGSVAGGSVKALFWVLF